MGSGEEMWSWTWLTRNKKVEKKLVQMGSGSLVDSIRRMNSQKYSNTRERSTAVQTAKPARVSNKCWKELQGGNFNQKIQAQRPQPNSIVLTCHSTFRILTAHDTQLGQRTQVASHWLYMPSKSAAHRGRKRSCLCTVI